MFSSTQNSPYKDRLLQMIGRVLVADNYLGVVFYNGRFAHFLPPGWHPAPSAWNGQLFQIPVKAYLLKINMPAQSADGFTFQATFSVLFSADPSRARSERQAEMAGIILERNADSVVRSWVERQAQYGMRKLVGEMDSEQLLAGKQYNCLERNLRHHLQATLSDLGFLFQANDSVLIESLTPPDTLINVQHMLYRRQKTADFLATHPQALQAHLLDTMAQSDNVFLNTAGPGNALHELYRAAFATNQNYPLSAHWQDTSMTMRNGSQNGKHNQEVIIDQS